MRLEKGGVPDEAISLIFASWRKKTESNYDSAWKKWDSWCVTRNTSPFDADLSVILGFLETSLKTDRNTDPSTVTVLQYLQLIGMPTP